MIRVDLERREIEASVRDLVEAPLDVPRPAGVLAGARAMLGTDVHRAWREAAERSGGEIAFEVAVSLSREVDGFAATIRGRADGVLEATGGSVVVEEVKSVEAAGETLAATRRSDHAPAVLQVRLYALCLARRRPEAEIAARLVLISIVDGSRRDLDVPFDAARAERVLDGLLRDAVARARAADARARVRTRAARALRFPYPEMRPHQGAFVDAVADGLARGRPVLATAPTGIGKTAAALLPALRHALDRDAVLFFLTAKTTQQALVASTFEDLVRASGEEAVALRALTFREKRGMCPPGNLLCHPDHCPYLAGFLRAPARVAALERLLDGGAHVGPDAIYAAGEQDGICPYGLALALTLRVELVICDYNYVYDPDVSLSSFAADGPRLRVVVVADEAHNLFDRAREYWSPFLARDLVADLRGRAERGEFLAPAERKTSPAPGVLDGRRLFEGIGAHLERLREALDGVVSSAEGHATIDGCRPIAEPGGAWAGLADEAARWMVRYAHYQQICGVVRPDDPLVGLLHTELRVRDLVALDEPEFVPYVSEGTDARRGAGFGVLCVNPARKLEERHRRVLGTVAMSATLGPTAYYADVLGLRPLEPVELAFDSPFPEEHRCVAVVPTVSTTWRERRRHYEGIARTIERVVGVRPGHYVAYFPSFAFLEAVRQRLTLDQERLLVQRPRMSPAERVRVLDELRAGGGPRLLLAVMGGVFAEGIDLPGEALVGAIVVGPGLPQVGFERALMQHYFRETGRDGFAYAMLFPGMRRVVQSAGRVHRTPEDRGVIVLLGRRFARSPYAECLPSWWSRYGPEHLVVEDPTGRLEAFWRAGDRAEPVARGEC